MKYFLAIMAILIAICCIVIYYQQYKTDHELTQFIGHPAKSLWAETMSNGETRHYTRWDNCSAVVSEYDHTYSYLTTPYCDTKE